MGTEVTFEEIRSRTRALMPDVTEQLKNLIRYPSLAFPGAPQKPVTDMADATAALLRKYGLQDVRLIDIPGGYPAVYGECPAPPGAPTVMMYAHYDVQPAHQEDGWETDPWTPVEKGGRIYGRGAADDKSGIVMIAASLAIFNGKPPVGVKVLIEGEEETNSHLEAFVAAHPDFFRCDAFIVADNGNLTVGDPALTTSLRGEVSCIVEVRTLESPVHSGTFGGAAPDALVALVRMLATLHDARGDVAVPGLRSYSHETMEYPEAMYRESAGMLAGEDLVGTGPLGARIWTKPSVTVIGIDAPSISASANILIPKAAAKISMRIAPDADPRHELSILTDHLRSVAPWNVHADIRDVSVSSGFVCPAGGPGLAAARRALETAFDKPVREKGTGGSIPLMHVLHTAVPHAEFILWGAEDAAYSCIHGTNESVDIGELERSIVAQGLFLSLLGTGRHNT
ncbi:MAG: M20/M25/M40 family metallo-hydrolase [Methanoregula sp.]|uniref:M20/M25/M40 family metallo-hydrolase n=1 Tax=Methanoregula sp. TaxID=2052170 RepID=UPI003C7669DB